jgi:hypothetical protein
VITNGIIGNFAYLIFTLLLATLILFVFFLLILVFIFVLVRAAFVLLLFVFLVLLDIAWAFAIIFTFAYAIAYTHRRLGRKPSRSLVILVILVYQTFIVIVGAITRTWITTRAGTTARAANAAIGATFVIRHNKSPFKKSVLIHNRDQGLK